MDVNITVTLSAETLETLKKLLTTTIGQPQTFEVNASTAKRQPEIDLTQKEEKPPFETETRVETVDRETVKAQMIRVLKHGHRKEVTELLINYGAKDLSGIPDDKLGAFADRLKTVGE